LKRKSYSTLWAGNDESWEVYISALSQQPPQACHSEEDDDDDDSERSNRILAIVDDIAVISVHGTLVNTDNWYNRYVGLIAYSEIIDALYLAAADETIKEIVLDVSSGGGAVNGVLDAVVAVERAARIKRVTAYTSSCMCSAAYWLVAPAHERYASAVAMTGSIGVVIKHVEYSKMAEKEGVKETVVRAGTFKQLANASEPLSGKAFDDLQEKAQYLYSVFVESVAGYLGVSYQACDTRMADGKEFIGKQAQDAGLVTGIANFEDVFGAIKSRTATNGGQDMKKRYLGAAAIAAATAGVEALATTGAAEAETNFPASTETKPEAETNTPTPTEADLPAADAGTVTYLSTQLKEKDEALIAAKVETAGLAKQVEALVGLKEALAEVTNNMIITLGGSRDEKLAESDPAALLSVYRAMATRVVEAFKVGGIAASREETEDEVLPTKSRLEKALESATLRNNNVKEK